MVVKVLNYWNNFIQIMFSNLNKEKLINYIIDILNEIKYFFDFFFKFGCFYMGIDKCCFVGIIQVDLIERKNIDSVWYIICY